MQKLLMYVLRPPKCDDLGVDIPLLGFSSLGIRRRRLSNHALVTATSTRHALHANMPAASFLRYSEGI